MPAGPGEAVVGGTENALAAGRGVAGAGGGAGDVPLHHAGVGRDLVEVVAVPGAQQVGGILAGCADQDSIADAGPSCRVEVAAVASFIVGTLP